nr:PorT family protein [Pseudopedobacter sp.]
MKKILFSVLFTFSSLLIFAQNDPGPRFKLGLTAHPTFGWLKSDLQDVKNDGLRAGFSYGLIGDFYFSPNYAFSTGIKLSTINGQTSVSDFGPANQPIRNNVYKLQYIEIPAKLKLTTNEIRGNKFYGEFGLGNGFNVSAKLDQKGDNGTIITEDRDISKDIAFYRSSLIIGAGAEIKLSDKTAVAAGLSYDNGFTNIQSNGSGKLKNSYLGLNIAVFF